MAQSGRGAVGQLWKALLLGVILLTAAASLIFLPTQQYVQNLLIRIQHMGFWGPVALAGVYVIASVFFVPASILSLGAGFLFGMRTGTVAVSIGATAGACVSFLLGKSFARSWIAQRIGHSVAFRAIDRAVAREGFKIVLLTRLTPVFPYTVLNYAFSLTAVSFWKYGLASWIGMLPATFFYVYLGSGLRSLAYVAAGNRAGGGNPVFFWVGMALTAVFLWTVTRIARQALRPDDRLATEAVPSVASGAEAAVPEG